MLNSFYRWIWMPFALLCYHFITVPGMRMFPLRWRLSGWRRVALFAGSALISAVCAQIMRLGVLRLLAVTGWKDAFFFRQICQLTALCITCTVIYRGSTVTKLLIINLALALANQLGYVYGVIMLAILGNEYSPIMAILRDILSFSAVGFFYHMLRRDTDAADFVLGRSDQAWLLTVVFLNFLLSSSAQGFLSPMPAMFFYCSGFLTTIAITFLLFRFALEHQKTLEQQTLLQDMRLSENNLSQIRETAAQLKEMRHELSNHFVYISSMLEQKQYDELEDYLQTVNDWHNNLTNMVATGHPVVNAVVNGKMSYARTLGIHTEVKAALPAVMPLDDLSLCSLLGNLLSNAIDACRGQDHPEISLQISPLKGYLVFRVENSVNTDVLQNNPHLLSTKADAENHGFGIRVIRRIAQEHNGILRYEMIAADRFCVQVMFPI